MDCNNFNSNLFFTHEKENAIPIRLITADNINPFLESLTENQRTFIKAMGFDHNGEKGLILPNIDQGSKLSYPFTVIVPACSQNPKKIVSIIDHLSLSCNAIYFDDVIPNSDMDNIADYWGANFYDFDFFKSSKQTFPKLFYPNIKKVI